MRKTKCSWRPLLGIWLVTGSCYVMSAVSSEWNRMGEDTGGLRAGAKFGIEFSNPTTSATPTMVRQLAERRRLSYESFAPLQCNSNLASQTCTNTWSSVFSNDSYHAGEVVIPCGMCVTMDLMIPSLTLAGGLDIQGKLVVPDGLRMSLSLPYLIVQGELHMSSTKIPNGDEDVKIVLTGTDDVELRPADSNSDRCGGVCPIGKKPFVVAGGKVLIEALPADTPTWVPLYDVLGSNIASTSGLIVNQTVAGKWGPGSEVLITSHTTEFDDQQVRRITAMYEAVDEYVVLELDSPIHRPTTVLDNPNFAVEVALLSRNIVFEGSVDDPNSRHGAHMMVYHTPMVPQTLEGVEFRNFGQQGQLGRYPIHFHLCDDVTGSTVSKNLVRQSNQRCIVIHGSHNLVVESNIAFDTQGHCFMTEDGNEQGNRFVHNLGALTTRVQTLISTPGGDRETDNRPSTFWMTNPTNVWEGNVAAGSQDNGYWLELRREVRGSSAEFYEDMNPKLEPMGLFKGNVAHSNRDKGMRTYPNGFEPSEVAVFLDSRFYRNRGDGLFLHNTRNVEVVGGVYADSRRQIDIDRADDIVVRDMEIIGESQEYRSLVQAQGVPGTCGRFSSVVGIEFHTFLFRQNLDDGGSNVHGIVSSGFVNTGCNEASVFRFDDEVKIGRFNYPTTVAAIEVEEGADLADFCLAENAGVVDVYLTDEDSSLKPASVPFEGTSTLVSDKPWMTGLIDDGKCQSVTDKCYAYCRDTCLRTVTYKIDPTQDDTHTLEVCNSIKPQMCIEVSSSMEVEYVEDDPIETYMRNTKSNKRRVFAVSVPKGEYTARVLDSNRSIVWPTFVEELYEQPTCSDALLEGSVDLVVPDVTSDYCRSLIRNGDAEEIGGHSPWLHRQGGIDLATEQGIDGSNALIDIVRRDSNRDAIGQYLDTRCMDLMIGRKYEIKVWVKLVDDVTGTLYTCDVNDEVCPEAGTYTHSDSGLISKQKDALVVSSFNTGQYQLIHGVLEVTEAMGAKPNVFFYIQRNHRNLAMLVDNVSVELMDWPTDRCYNLIYNGDFRVGDSRFWMNDNGDRVVMVKPGSEGQDDFALMTVDGSPQQFIQNHLVVPGETYVVTAKFKLTAGLNSDQLYCQVDSREPSSRCPEMWMRVTDSDGAGRSTRIARVVSAPQVGEWGVMSGEFTGTEIMAGSASMKLTFRLLHDGVDLTLDDVSIHPRDSDDCEPEGSPPGQDDRDASSSAPGEAQAPSILPSGAPTSTSSPSGLEKLSSAPSGAPTFSSAPSGTPTFSASPSVAPTSSTAPSARPTSSSAPSASPTSSITSSAAQASVSAPTGPDILFTDSGIISTTYWRLSASGSPTCFAMLDFVVPLVTTSFCALVIGLL